VFTRGLPSLWSKLLQQFGVRQHFVLHSLVQGIKLGFKIVMKLDLPIHVLGKH
jgi:hypothetical protein